MQNEISVYVDIIFLENLIIDYVIIDICGRAAGFLVKPIRVFLGGIVGAMYAVVICVFTLLNTNALLSIILKLLISGLMCGIAFGVKNRRKFILCNILLYAVSFIFAGVFMALKISGSPVSVDDGAVIVSWGESSSLYIAGTVFVGYMVVTLLIYCIKKRKTKIDFLDIVIEIEGRNEKIVALCDTGNELRDNIRNLPVIICEITVLEKFIDPSIFMVAKKIVTDDTEDKIFKIVKFFESIGFADRISVIPYKTVGGDSMMVGVAADKVYLQNDFSCSCRATICFIDKILSESGEYNAIASPEIFV